MDNALTTINNKITNGSVGPVQRTTNTDELTLVELGKDATNPGNAQKLTNLADGTISAASKDAVNGSQLFATNTNVSTIATNTSTYLGGGADVLAGTAPTYTIQTGTYNNVGDALGGVDNALTTINNKITNGSVGPVQRTTNTDELTLVELGKDATNPGNAQKLTNLADGTISATSKDAINGSQIHANQQSIADHLGTGAQVNTDGTITGPVYTVQSGNYNTVYDAFGAVDGELTTIHGDITNINNGKVGPVQRTANTDELTLVELGKDATNPGNAQKLTNLADGTISATSKDAINGSQLFATNTNVSTIATNTSTYLGGGADVLSGTAPTYTIQSGTYHDVGSALGGVDNELTTIHGNINNINNGKVGPVQRTTNTDELTLVALGGDAKNPGNAQKLTNLADGVISATSKDAVNGSQIYANNQIIASYFGAGAAYNNGSWTGPNFQYQTVNSSGNIVNGQANNVGDALADLGNGVSNVNNRVDNIETNVGKLNDDALKWNDTAGAYDASSKNGKPNKIVNVEDGTVAKGSKDAVNGGQLWETNNRVDDLESKTGDLADGAVMYDKDSDGKKTNSVTLKGGDPSAPVTIKNVADGEIKTGSKDAVNGGQLHDYTKEQMNIVYDNSKKYTDQKVQGAVQEANAYTDMKFGQLNQDVYQAKKEARQAAAIGLAAASLRYDDNPGKISVAFGSGLWKSQGALAFGAGYTSESGKFRTNISSTVAGDDFGVGAGLSITLN